MMKQPEPISVFLSYAHEDEPLRKELEKHLSLLQRQGLVSTWHDRQITAGTNWTQALDEHLNNASIILLLISSNFLASDYCYGIEMQCALERHETDQARVIPILLRPVDWKDAPFAHLQVLPTDARAITDWRNRDKAFVDVVAGIRRGIEDLPFLAASPSRMLLPAIWNIPYPRNLFFTARDELLSRLHDQLQTGQTTALSQSPQAISGLGGIGKTQIAIEYAYRYHQEYQAVLWASAQSQETLTSSYTTIATLLKLPERAAEEQDLIIQAVKTWLQTHQGWLLILDNADELKILPPFLPPSVGGHLLLTTRAWDMQRLAQRIEVATFSQVQGATFLLQRAGRLSSDAALNQTKPEEQAVALQLTEEVGGLPLALDQAGAYLQATGASLEQYQQIYHTHRRTLLQERRSLVPDHPDAVATTWSLSFQQVKEKNAAAVDLLRLCAFLAADSIPEEIFTQGASHLGPLLEHTTTDAFLFNQAIEALRAYSLLSRDPRTHTLSVHRLVQAVLKDQMNEQDRKLWAQRAVRAVNAAFPEVEHQAWPQCDRLLAHALLCAGLIEQEQIHTPEAARLLNQTGDYLSERARYTEAEPLLKRALSICEQQLGPQHPSTALSLNNLANLYCAQGKYEQAEPLYQRALSIREQQLGPLHPDTATSLNNLALLYKTQGKYEQAEPLYQHALAIREQQLGPLHPDTANSLNNLANLYRSQGKYEQAELLYQRALAINEQQLGPDHPDTATSLNNLATLYSDQGQYEQAEPLYQRALAIREKQLGPQHPHTANSLNNLAALYLDQGKYEQAELLYQRALAINEQQLGPLHPDTATSLNNLAALYSDQGQYEQAEPLLVRALAICEQQLGPDHPDTATSLNNLAALYYAQEKYEQAEPLFQRALAIREQQLGPDHPDTATSLNNLAGLYSDQGKYEQAEPLYQHALAIREQQLGPLHPDTANSLNNLAALYLDQGKYEQAELLYQRALAINEQQLGPLHPDTATSLNNLAALYETQGKYEQAEPLYLRALQISEQQPGPDHPNTATSLNNLALFYSNQGKYEQAEPLCQRALQIREQQLGPQHPHTATSLNNLAGLYYNQGKYEQAQPLYQRALSIKKGVLGPQHPSTQLTRTNYTYLLRTMGRDAEATALDQP